MSLFEDENYQYCDTFFIFFDAAKAPTLNALVSTLNSGGENYVLENAREKDGTFESITVRSPHDSSAMDIILVSGPEVQEQTGELVGEMRNMSLEGDDFNKLMKIETATARMDVFHFERKSNNEPTMVDPGGLFLIIDKLNNILGGVGHDPQSKTLI